MAPRSSWGRLPPWWRGSAGGGWREASPIDIIRGREIERAIVAPRGKSFGFPPTRVLKVAHGASGGPGEFVAPRGARSGRVALLDTSAAAFSPTSGRWPLGRPINGMPGWELHLFPQPAQRFVFQFTPAPAQGPRKSAHARRRAGRHLAEPAARGRGGSKQFDVGPLRRQASGRRCPAAREPRFPALALHSPRSGSRRSHGNLDPSTATGMRNSKRSNRAKTAPI